MSSVCAMHNANILTEEDILKALYTLKDNEFEAPVRWDLHQVQPPYQLVTKPFILEYMRIECNFGYKDSQKGPGDPASDPMSVSDEQPVSNLIFASLRKFQRLSSWRYFNFFFSRNRAAS